MEDVIDYRKMNEISIDDKFPIPNIENIIDKLGQGSIFYDIRFSKRIPSDNGQRRRSNKDSLFNSVCTLRVCQDAIWAEECSVNIPEAHEFCVTTIHQ